MEFHPCEESGGSDTQKYIQDAYLFSNARAPKMTDHWFEPKFQYRLMNVLRRRHSLLLRRRNEERGRGIRGGKERRGKKRRERKGERRWIRKGKHFYGQHAQLGSRRWRRSGA